MTTIAIQLPDDVSEFAEQYARQRGFSSVSEFISSLVVEVSERQQRLESQLLEGVNSGPAIPMSADDWSQLRARVASKNDL